MLSSAPALDGCVAGTDDLDLEREPEFEKAADSAPMVSLFPRRDSIRATGRLRLTEALWGIRWEELLPCQVTEEVVVVPSSFEQSQPFIEAHYAEIFEEDGEGRFFRCQRSQARTRYYRTVGDFFEFKASGQTVALLIGTAVDWSTYYIRSAAALPEVQGKKVIQRFFPEMFGALRAAGVERVEAETSPSNMATLHLLSRLRFNPSGTVLTDRWGAMLRFTRFLDEDAEETFLNQFCTGVRYQRRARNRLRGGPTKRGPR